MRAEPGGLTRDDKYMNEKTNQALIVLCTCPNEETAAELANELVARRLAACVNVIGHMRSIYRWEGAINTDDETMMLIKTTASAFPALETVIMDRHPYELPEIIAVPVERGSERYLAWINDSLS